MLSTGLVERLNNGSDQRFRWLLAALFGVTICNTYLPSGYDWSGLIPEPTSASEQLREAQATGSWAKRLQWIPLYLVAIYVIWIRRGLVWLLAPHLNPFLLLFVLWATASVLWSYDPAATLRRVIQVWGVILIATAFCLSAWHRDRFVDVVRGAHSFMLLLSLFFVVAIPSLGIHHGGEHPGAWRGATSHKNGMGALAALTFLIWVHAWGARRVVWYRAMLMVALSGLFLLMARSTTSLLIAISMAPLVWVLVRPPIESEGWLLKLILVSILLLALPVHFYWVSYGVPTFADIFGPVAELFGKDVTLTGRSEIWALMGEQIATHPLEGTGYGGFWLGEEGPSGAIARKLNFYPSQAHNGYIDVVNETGIVGMTLVALFLVYHLLRLGRTGFDRSNFAFHFFALVVMLVWNVTESSLFRPVSSWLVISIASSIVVSRAGSPIERVAESRNRSLRSPLAAG